MKFFSTRIFVLNTSVLRKMLYYNLYKKFGWRRALFTIIYLFLHILAVFILILGRLLDEVLYPAYKNTKIVTPLYIIANPRSGTTFLHRLMSLDSEKYAFTYLYSALFPSVTIIRLIHNIGRLDGLIGGPLKKIITWSNGVFFGGWKDIHPMGFDQTEEDEPMFSIPLMTPGVFMLCPFLDKIDDTKFMDNLSPAEQSKWMDYYESSIQRFMYATGGNKIYLAKNVMSTGRIQCIRARFPDARFIYLARHPYQGLPSLISMFTAAWKVHSMDCVGATPQSKAWGQLAIDYYLYFARIKETIDPNSIIYIPYARLVEDPLYSIKSIYEFFGLEFSEQFLKNLNEELATQKKYMSKHGYSLQEYGWTKEEVNEQMERFMIEYNFTMEAN